MVVACGAAVPQAAGRGLGHTGGTLDKLESIPGFSAEIPTEQVRRQLCDVGAAIFAAGELAPADLVEAYNDELSNPWIAAERGYVDRVIPPRDTRAEIAKALRLLRTKRAQLPPKKHGNIPL